MCVNRVRKFKERYAMTDMRKEANRRCVLSLYACTVLVYCIYRNVLCIYSLTTAGTSMRVSRASHVSHVSPPHSPHIHPFTPHSPHSPRLRRRMHPSIHPPINPIHSSHTPSTHPLNQPPTPKPPIRSLTHLPITHLPTGRLATRARGRSTGTRRWAWTWACWGPRAGGSACRRSRSRSTVSGGE